MREATRGPDGFHACPRCGEKFLGMKAAQEHCAMVDDDRTDCPRCGSTLGLPCGYIITKDTLDCPACELMRVTLVARSGENEAPATVEWAKGIRGAKYDGLNFQHVVFFGADEPSVIRGSLETYFQDDGTVDAVWFDEDGSRAVLFEGTPISRARFAALLLGLGVTQEGGEG